MKEAFLRWSALLEARMLGLVAGWPADSYGPLVPRALYRDYAAGLQRRVVDFSGEGLMDERTRQAFLDALAEPDRAAEFLRPILGAAAVQPVERPDDANEPEEPEAVAA